MLLTDLPIETLRAEFEFVRPALTLPPSEASDIWGSGSPICRIKDECWRGCPLYVNDDDTDAICDRMVYDDTVHAAAREYIAALEAAIAEKEGANDA